MSSSARHCSKNTKNADKAWLQQAGDGRQESDGGLHVSIMIYIYDIHKVHIVWDCMSYIDDQILQL